MCTPTNPTTLDWIALLTANFRNTSAVQSCTATTSKITLKFFFRSHTSTAGRGACSICLSSQLPPTTTTTTNTNTILSLHSPAYIDNHLFGAGLRSGPNSQPSLCRARTWTARHSRGTLSSWDKHGFTARISAARLGACLQRQDVDRFQRGPCPNGRSHNTRSRRHSIYSPSD